MGQAAPAPDPLASLGALDRFSGRTRKIMGTYALGVAAASVVQRTWGMARGAMTYSITVNANDDLYRELNRWLMSQDNARRRSLRVKSGTGSGSNEVVEVGQEPKRRLELFYDSLYSQTVRIDGHRVKVLLDKPDWSRFKDSEDASWARDLERLILTTWSPAGRDAILRLLDQLLEESKERKPRLYIAERWGGWNTRDAGPVRSLDTVVLKGGQKEMLVDDLTRFLRDESYYLRLGIDYHRGYLFTGPPGTGKTSLAQALAAHFGMDLYYIPLSAMENDAYLIQLMSHIKSRSMLLLEDIDIVHGARTRDDSEKGVTLSGLLNTLDGTLSTHGLITVLTTNDRSVLDDALTRPGRVDIETELGYLDEVQLHEMLRTFGVHDDIWILLKREDVPPAAISEIIKRHLANPTEALAEIEELVHRDS